MERSGSDIAALLAARRQAVSQAVADADLAARPELAQRYGARARAHYLRDNDFHLDHLGAALEADSPQLFLDYVCWAKDVLTTRGIATEDLAHSLRLLAEMLESLVPEDHERIAPRMVRDALARMPDLRAADASMIAADEANAGVARDYLERLLAADRAKAVAIAVDPVEQGRLTIPDLYLGVLQPVQREIGRLWQMNRATVAQEHYCSAATQVVISQFCRRVIATPKTRGTVVVAAVQGELHEIGPRMVADLLELDGWDVHYLGANMPTAVLWKTLEDVRPRALALSATMPPHLAAVREIIAGIRERAALAEVKVAVGGNLFTMAPELWSRIGADGCARDAAGAAELLRCWE